MLQYIDKSVLVEDIDRRIKTNKECMLGLRNLDYYQGKIDALNDTLSFLDTLEVEVEEVDLKKEIYDAQKRFGDIDEMGGYRILIFDDEFRDVLRHFYELGLKTKKEE